MNRSDTFFQRVLNVAFGKGVHLIKKQSVAGGDISEAVRLDTDSGSYFLKYNECAPANFFEREASGMKELRRPSVIKVPEVICVGNELGYDFILLEYIAQHRPGPYFWRGFGSALAGLHRNCQLKYGFQEDNYIGRLHQSNEQTDDWVDFFIHQRLEVQLGQGLSNRRFDQAYANRFRKIYPLLSGLLPREPASLLHGDLWSGNFLAGVNDEVWIFDPAVYYGSREMELAFTKLFGGFHRDFYRAYEEVYPLNSGFEDRVDIYNLYPLLVHVNLFGNSYLSGIDRTLKGLI